MTPTHPPRPAHPLRLRAFRLLFTGRLLSLLGDGVVPAALVIAVTRVTGDVSALALVLGCATVPRLLLLPLGGVVADRFDARRVALTTDLVRCVAQLLVGAELLGLLGGDPVLLHIAAAEAVGGAASAFAMPTQSPLVAASADGEARRKANALMGMASSATRLCGPGLAAALIWAAGPGLAFMLDAASFAVSAALLTVIRVERVPLPRASVLTDLKEGWREVRSRDWYWTSLVAHGTWNGAAAVLTTLGPAVVITRLGSEGVWFWVLEAGAIGLVLGSLPAARLRPRRPVLIANLGLATYALPLALLAAAAPAPLLIAAYGLAMAALGFLSPVWETVVQQEVPPQALARVTSYDWLLSLAAMPFGYALAPPAAAAWGSAAPLAVCAVLVAIACLATAAVPGVRAVGAPAPAASGPETSAAPAVPAAAPTGKPGNPDPQAS
ncbi:MFS transporter [Streptomyces sp. NPDC002574]|uniref:MFS transporter n=1 Tax=Streptomyces sp. NPDC002574 TaxID=3364652 RepID=UPI0036CA5CF5